jgi:hypothetical protein
LIIIGAAALGTMITVASASEPGAVLGVLVVAATVAAALAVRAGAVYQLIPVPAPVYIACAAICGLIRDRASGASLTVLAVHAAQWIGDGFPAMSVATALAMVIAAVRWPGWRRGSRGPRPQPARGPARRPAPHRAPPGHSGRSPR